MNTLADVKLSSWFEFKRFDNCPPCGVLLTLTHLLSAVRTGKNNFLEYMDTPPAPRRRYEAMADTALLDFTLKGLYVA